MSLEKQTYKKEKGIRYSTVTKMNCILSKTIEFDLSNFERSSGNPSRLGHNVLL